MQIKLCPVVINMVNADCNFSTTIVHMYDIYSTRVSNVNECLYGSPESKVYIYI